MIKHQKLHTMTSFLTAHHLTTGCAHQWQSRSIQGCRYTLWMRNLIKLYACVCVGAWVYGCVVRRRGHVNRPNITARSSICTVVRGKLYLVHIQMPSLHPLMGSGTGPADLATAQPMFLYGDWKASRCDLSGPKLKKKILHLARIISCLPSRCL